MKITQISKTPSEYIAEVWDGDEYIASISIERGVYTREYGEIVFEIEKTLQNVVEGLNE